MECATGDDRLCGATSLLGATLVPSSCSCFGGAVGGFVLGFMLDVVYDMWGMHMLLKTVIGFLLGLFPSSEREGLLILPRQAFLGGLVIALVHNGIFVTMLALQAGARNSFLVAGLWIASALYTAFLGTFASMMSSR